MTSLPDPARCSGARRAASAAVTLIASLAVLLSVGPTAAAHWAGSGSGSGLAVAGTLASPVGVVVPGVASPEVPVTWAQGVGAIPPSGYYVTRHVAGASTGACLSSPTALLQGTACTDRGVPDGEYSYTVTAVFRSWTASSTPSGGVVVAGPSALVFTAQIANPTAGAPITPGVTVALETAGGTPYAAAGTSVTIALGSSPSGGTLSGETTATTNAAGAATFETLSINEPGIGYTLTASGNGLASATSDPFDVTEPPLLGAAAVGGSTLLNPPPVALGSAGTFSVLAGTAVVNTGATTMTGDLGVSPGTQVTGFGPGSYDGTLHAGDLTAELAQADLLAALTDASSRTPDTQIVGDLASTTFHVGVHHSTAALTLTGMVTLDAEGDPNAVFIFQTDAAFNTTTASSVNLVNGAQPSNVFWSVAGAATTGDNSDLAGTILAEGAITLGADSSLTGHALSRDTVTLATNLLTGATPAAAARMAADAGVTSDLGETSDQDAASALDPISEPASPAPASTGPDPDGASSPTPDTGPSPTPLAPDPADLPDPVA